MIIIIKCNLTSFYLNYLKKTLQNGLKHFKKYPYVSMVKQVINKLY